MSTPPLGYIEPKDRTQSQHDAHADATSRMMAFTLPPVTLAKGDKVILTDYLKHPDVIADIGFEFTGYRQLTGSCVGVSAGNAITALSAVQRTIADNPTKALAVWWGFPYGRTRFNEGDRGQGEGAVDSVMGQTLKDEGVFDINQSGLPTFSMSDGLAITSHEELQWSDGGKIAQKWKDLAKQYPVGGVAPLSNTQDIVSCVVNGYPVLDGCSKFCGHGTIKGEGENAYVVGHYDGTGGHSTGAIAVWMHPNDGLLIGYWNQWNGSTYPKDPAGLARCCVWMPESEWAKLFSQYGGRNGETMGLSHLNYMPAQPKVIAGWF